MKIWSGESLLTGEPISLYMTFGSSNRKTGKMAQTWILRDDVEPHRATLDEQRAVCGDCKLRDNGCYVTKFQAPLTVYRRYVDTDIVEPPKRIAALRIGSYGDPAAVPFKVWRKLVMRTQGTITGYTHSWREADRRLQKYCMASVDTPSEALMALADGWSIFATFRVFDGLQCPADRTGGLVKCITCGKCDGNATKQRAIWIRPHGAQAKRVRAITQSGVA